jgi:hypothetical protein
MSDEGGGKEDVVPAYSWSKRVNLTLRFVGVQVES